ncbi:prostatic acid phosphatase-like [Contarinia nasturtii]|uniref:prostatic acid phosphatase-like n=1 Tax=Contarinia nasturtii TaxID=265458 RepID=UPI0012D3E95C|nr:prostatic acid phosphatase-like [Contarinia nasturtii]
MFSRQLVTSVLLLFGNFLLKCEAKSFFKHGATMNGIHLNDSELIFAHVVYRHGDRTIQYGFPNDPWRDEEHWLSEGGFGALTREGKRQHYKLGQYLRRRYGKILGDHYSPNKVYIISTDMDRTLMSAQANLAGLFPPHADEIWNECIPWQPIPVHTIPVQSDYVLNHLAACPKYGVAFDKFMQESPEVQQIYTKYADKFEYWSKMSGANITTIKNVFDLHKTLYIETVHNKPLQKWAQKEFKSGVMEKIANFRMKLATNTKELARLRIGFLLKDMLERFAQKINKTLKPDRSIVIFSAHDLTIANILNALGVFNPHVPPYASSLHFELYKNSENEHYIQLFYRKSNEEHLSPLNLPNCGTMCSLNRLYELYSEIIPVDYESECF